MATLTVHAKIIPQDQTPASNAPPPVTPIADYTPALGLFLDPQPRSIRAATDRIAYVLNSITEQDIPAGSGAFALPAPTTNKASVDRLAAVVVSEIDSLIPMVPAGVYSAPQPRNLAERIQRLAGVITSLIEGDIP